MKYIKESLFITTLLLSTAYSQSDTTNVCVDIDGNLYETVQIGGQLWMAENLKTTHYNNGDEIPNITSNGDWGSLTTGACGDYDNNPTNSDTYGKQYNWYTVDDDRGVCPAGWHVPSDNEWNILVDFLGGWEVAGGKIKESGHEHWNYISDMLSEESTNESGFTAFPAGYRYHSSGIYYGMGRVGYFWSSSEHSSTDAWYRTLNCSNSAVGRNYDYKQAGCSVRCLGD